MDEVVEAAKASNAHNFISQLPQAYDTQCAADMEDYRRQGGIHQLLATEQEAIDKSSMLQELQNRTGLNKPRMKLKMK
ncbi:putative ABC-type xenobiotic transporter [Helianthus debilis subsp. tardiflorus]